MRSTSNRSWVDEVLRRCLDPIEIDHEWRVALLRRGQSPRAQIYHAETIGLPDDKVRRQIRYVLDPRDSGVFDPGLGENGNRLGYVLNTFCAFSCGDDDFLKRDLLCMDGRQ